MKREGTVGGEARRGREKRRWEGVVAGDLSCARATHGLLTSHSTLAELAAGAAACQECTDSTLWPNLHRALGHFDLPAQQRSPLPHHPLPHTSATMSQQALNKIAPNSPSRAKPSEIETQIATALYELETNIPDMRGALRPLQFVSAREVR